MINQIGVKDENNGGKKREKKVFDMPGQKRDPPDEVLTASLSPIFRCLYNFVGIFVGGCFCSSGIVLH